MLEIKRLVCPHCGRELKGPDPYITRFCSTCLRHWIITGEELSPLAIRRALTDQEADLMLPFWISIIDNHRLAADISEAVDELRRQRGMMASVRMEGEQGDDFLDQFTRKSGMEKMEMLSAGRVSSKMAGLRQIDNFINEIRGYGSYRVYVPAFISSNPFAYLKAGKMLTARQPSFKMEPSASLRNPVLCSVDSSEASALMDFVFLASLPKAILRYGQLLKDIRVQAAGPPSLVNFPFRAGKGSLISIIGEFSISSRLVQRAEIAGGRIS